MITKSQALKFVLLPELGPRIRELKLNFGWFAYLMALIFSATRILPRTHPYLAAEQAGKFGIGDVLFEAGRFLKGGVKHTDQYLIYGSFVLGIFLLIAQFVVLAFMIAASAAHADVPWQGMFVTPMPENDLALMMLDRVFEIPNMFGSRFNPTDIGQIPVFASALHQIFAFYNFGMLLVAGLIVLYFIFAVVIESMQTGSPFGQRFQEVFVPIRLILALIFLVPLGYGFSSGQMLVLQLAKWGSAFATNGWLLFNEKAGKNPLGAGSTEMLAMPKTQEVEDLLRFYSLVQSCRAAYDQLYGKEIQPYLIVNSVEKNDSTLSTGVDYETALSYFPDTNIKITFGEKKDSYTRYKGKVKPYCGTIDVATSNYEKESARLIQSAYWEFLKTLWEDTNLKSYGARRAKNSFGVGDPTTDTITVAGWTDAKQDPDVGYYADMRTVLQAAFNAAMDDAKDNIRDTPEAEMPMTKEMMEFGWGGAGIWFNRIAEYNGALMSSTMSVPTPASYPAAMQWMLTQKKSSETGTRNTTQFIATFGDGSALKDMISGGKLDDPAKDSQIATFLGSTFTKLTEDNVYGDGTEGHDDNVIANLVNTVFGTYGLFELRGNDQIHPLAKMSALGRSILDRSIMYIGGAMVMGGLEGLSSHIDSLFSTEGKASGISAAFSGMAGMFKSFAMVTLMVGVMLYYVIPMIPFLYFFFAVGRWVKSIFEAVVGIPLWALAHLRIDGEGIPGPAAANGYYLLLEIFLRPILVIFGLMAAVSCFSALAIGLDSIFDLVVKNVTGYTPIDKTGTMSWQGKELRRGSIDQFFYTIMYAILLYMMALSCFKLIDLIPNSVLRFIGTQVSEFNDRLDLEGEVMKSTTAISYSIGPQIAEAAEQAGNIAGQAVTAPIGIAKDLENMAQRMSAAPPAKPTETPPAQTPPPATAATAPSSKPAPSETPAATPAAKPAPKSSEPPAASADKPTPPPAKGTPEKPPEDKPK